MASFTAYKQYDQMDCGPTCLRMIARHYGRRYTMKTLRKKSGINREGVSLLGISEAAEEIGFRTIGAKLSWEQLLEEVQTPCVVYWKQYHFVVVYRIKKSKVYIADPAKGRVTYSKEEFLQAWLNTKSEGRSTGICLLVYTTPKFYNMESEASNNFGLGRMAQYILPYKNLLFQLGLGLLAGSILQLIFPFLTQAIVDIGISNRNLDFINIVLLAQIILFIGRTGVEFIRSWILLHMSTRINISILSDFLIKLMKLPMPFFDTKMVGDIMQRMGDHSRIQNFLTTKTLGTLFSGVNLLVFSVVLIYYHIVIFFVFLVSSILYVVWILLFLKKREELDHQRFSISSDDQSKVIQLIQGMQEIKLNGCERQKRWEWERLQARLFKFSIKNLALSQYQKAGAFFINGGKDIAITFISAVAVVNGQLTLGGMMAVQYIVGQLNGPIQQLIGFVQSAQDAYISLGRLGEIHSQENEEPANEMLSRQLPKNKSINIKHMWFTYPGAGNEPVLEDINLCIPEGKVTAIVGMSGSGKTTLLKLLLKFYKPDKGNIRIDQRSFSGLSPRSWRSQCGVVMQDGFIFSDTIAGNIAVKEECQNRERLECAVNVANIQSFIESLPLGLNTKIGTEGNGISQGQRQRILIARAVYKDPDYLFFDEATNALDANNEKRIMKNLRNFFQERTVIIVAHRLSTVKKADNIIVLDEGRIIEQGAHQELIQLKGSYFDLVKNQLELGM